ncbi:MAG: DUF5131 family protein [Phycisphaerae bacterium]
MAQSSSIEWTEATWNPVVGCRKVSAGCAHCYAERMAKRLAAIAKSQEARQRNAGRAANYLQVINQYGRWNGSVYLDESAVDFPLNWRTPRTIFVNSMSDLFHEDVPLDFIQRVFAVMNRCPQHTFQVLTKRPERAAEFSDRLKWSANIWMGTSVENAAVSSRVHDLRNTDAEIKFLSVEPLLGPIPQLPVKGIQWVIVGGESGPGARPMDPDWVDQIHQRCVKYNIPFFFKQWGGVNKKKAGRELAGRTWDEMPRSEAAYS